MPSGVTKSPSKEQLTVIIEGPNAAKAARAKYLVREWINTSAEASTLCDRLNGASRHDAAILNLSVLGYIEYMRSIENDFGREYPVHNHGEDAFFFDSFTMITDSDLLSCRIEVTEEGELEFYVDCDKSIGRIT